MISAGRSPYRLYALSNAGSLLGLLSYPFVVEPSLTLDNQAGIWSAGFALFAAGSGACAWSGLGSGLGIGFGVRGSGSGSGSG